MNKYKINEIFYSLQAEGYWAGRPAVFIRFSGCNLHCDWCDTHHEHHTEMTAREIWEAVAAFIPKPEDAPMLGPDGAGPMVVLTGGEPLLQVDDELLGVLHRNFVAVETNGTKPFPSKADWITLSPKYEHKLVVPLDHVCCVHEVKVVLDGKNDPEQYRLLGMHRFIQPCSGDFEPAIEYVKTHPWWRLSVQWQKLINIQ